MLFQTLYKKGKVMQKISRVMVRLNFLIKFQDELLKDSYYVLLRSSKLWSDINFINTRVFALENQNLELTSNFDKNFESELKKFTDKQAKELVFQELNKVFGIRDFKGKLLNYKLSYIEESKRFNEMTYYLHLFYRISYLPELNRLIGLDNIELMSEKLLIELSNDEIKLHENYKLSKIIQEFFKSQYAKKEKIYFIKSETKLVKKKIAVLFSDLKNFGNIVQKYEAEHPSFTKDLIKKYQYDCSFLIKSNGGYVVQTAGDAFMAIFTLSENIERDLFLVIKSAIGMICLDELKIYKQKVSLVTRIGINLAEVEEGYLGAPDLREYTVFGKDVNIASRLEKKVEELSLEIPNFQGGFLCNLAGLKESFLPDTIQGLNQLFFKLESQINKEAPEWLKDTLIQEIINKREILSYLPAFFRLKRNIQTYVNSEYSTKKNFIQVNPKLQSIPVKEGLTQCIFVYRYN